MNAPLHTVLSHDGTSIAYQRSDAGQPIILVSPALADRTSNNLLAKLLSRNLTTINYDRRGRGASADVQPYAVQREIEDIEALINVAGGSAYLFGSSSGAVLALEAAAALGSKVKALFMYEPPFIVDDTRPSVPPDYLPHLEDLLATNQRGDAVEYFMRVAVRIPQDLLGRMRAMPTWPSLEAAAHTLPYDGRVMGDTMSGKPLSAQQWKSMAAPGLVMSGGSSPAWLHNAAQAVATVFPQVTYRSLEGLDHAAVTSAPLDIATTMYGFFLSQHMKKAGH